MKWRSCVRFFTIKLSLLLLSFSVFPHQLQQNCAVLFSESLIPMTSFHRALDSCMHVYGLVYQDSGALCMNPSILSEKVTLFQQALEELILGDLRFVHQDDLYYLASLVDRIQLSCKPLMCTQEVADQLNDIALTITHIINA